MPSMGAIINTWVSHIKHEGWKFHGSYMGNILEATNFGASINMYLQFD